MKSYRVNGDYEQQLFYQRPGPAALDQALEFLFFFLSQETLWTLKKYSDFYLTYVERVTGKRPLITSTGPYENWWGPLKNREQEKWWNSKITTSEFLIEQGLCEDTHILTAGDQLEFLKADQTYLMKDPFGMSGQKFQILGTDMSLPEKKQLLNSALERGPLIVESWLKRVWDFSHYIYSNGERIVYQNLVDQKFQYKGTCFQDYQHSQLKNLSFYLQISDQEWKQFETQLQRVINHFARFPNEAGFSIDSFIYEDQGRLKIRLMTEVNYRRTMGRVAFDFAQRFGNQRPWARLELFKVQNCKEPLWEKLRELELKPESTSGLLVLSPGDTRFEMIFFSAASDKEGEELLKKTKALLS